MNLETVRAKQIAAWQAAHPELKSTDERLRLSLNGEPKVFDVWRIPLHLLIYNIRNGRFAAELIAKEKELRRRLDSTKTADGKIIRQLLLEQNDEETEALKQNIKAVGQLEPGVVTHDGSIINANRRAAILSVLREETGDPKFDFLRCGVLPPGVDETDLWRIEAGLQFAKDFLLDYGPINELLKLREGERRGLTPTDISNTLLGRFSVKQVEDKLEILKLVDNYLGFVGKTEQYDEVEGDVEKFNSLYKNVIAPLKKIGVASVDVQKITLIGFCLIRSGDATHWDIRKLKDVAQLADAKKEVYSAYNAKEPKKTNDPEIVEAFRSALDRVDDEKETNSPERLLKRALLALRAINPKAPAIKAAPVATLLQELKQAVLALLATTEG
jgi:hypothetical protein